jgi:hypothetical protein
MAANSLLAKFLPGGRLVHKMDSRKREDVPSPSANVMSSSTSDTANTTNMHSPNQSQLRRTSSSSFVPFSNPYATRQQSFPEQPFAHDYSNGSIPSHDPIQYPSLQSPSYPNFSLPIMEPQEQSVPQTYSQPQSPPIYQNIAPRPASIPHEPTPRSAPTIVLKSKPISIDSDEDTIQYAAPKRRTLRTPKQNTSLKALENVNGLLDRKHISRGIWSWC